MTGTKSVFRTESVFRTKLVFHWLYPSFCRGCDVFIERGLVLCRSCRSKIVTPKPSSLLLSSGVSLKVYAFSEYKDPLRRMVLGKMFGDRLASRQLASLMLALLMREGLPISRDDFDAIVPIPLHWTRYARRGFNQSYEMAKVLSAGTGIPVMRALKRKKRTGFQSRLSFARRQKNVKNVFCFRRSFDKTLLKGKKVLLVDDLLTTGATLKNAARPLLGKGIKQISALVGCKVQGA